MRYCITTATDRETKVRFQNIIHVNRVAEEDTMGKRELRRSRSWRDLSLFMKMGFSKDSSSIPALPSRSLKRTSSLGRRGMENRTREDITRSRILGDNIIPSIPDQKIKEKEFQRRASIKRKVVPESVVHTTTTPSIKTSTISPESRRPSTASHTNQLPAFTFSTKSLENSPVTTSILPPVTQPESSSPGQNGRCHQIVHHQR